METIPSELVEEIGQYLTGQELAACCAVSHQWRNIFNDDLLWRPKCDHALKEHLDSTPCVVEPVFNVLEVEVSLSPICQWRLAFMRQTHLWNNWRLGRYKKEMLIVQHPKVALEKFVTNDYVVSFHSDHIELWDVSVIPAVSVASSPIYRNKHYYSYNNEITGNNLVIIVNLTGVQVFHVHLSLNYMDLKHIFVLDEPEKLSETESDVISTKLNRLSDGAIFVVICNVLVGLVYENPTKLHVWDLGSGLKLKEENCPIKPGKFVDIRHSETSEDICVVVEFDFVVNDMYGHNSNLPQGKLSHFFVYSLKLLAFLPFLNICNTSNTLCYAILTNYFAVNNLGTLKVYNYLTAELLLELPDVENISTINNSFIFEYKEKFQMFHPQNKTVFSLPDVNIEDFSVISDNLVELQVIDTNSSEVWKIGSSFFKTNIIFPEFKDVNKACTRVIVERTVEEEDTIAILHLW